jgi:hypothetical protein
MAMSLPRKSRMALPLGASLAMASGRQFGDVGDLAAVGRAKQDTASGDLELARQQAKNRCRGHALAAAALADQGQRLAGRELKAHRLDHVDRSLIRGKHDLQVADL